MRQGSCSTLGALGALAALAALTAITAMSAFGAPGSGAAANSRSQARQTGNGYIADFLSNRARKMTVRR